jgi:arginyl-tRNA synthetase
LIKLLSLYPEVVNTAACVCEPHRLTTYLQEVAGLFHSYYNSHRVLVDDSETSAARLYLVNAVRHVLANALSLLGINAPERM